MLVFISDDPAEWHSTPAREGGVSTQTKPEPTLEAQPLYAPLKADALNHPALANSSKDIAITSDEDHARVSKARAAGKLIVKTFEDMRKRLTAPLLKEQRAIKAEADRWTEPLVEWDQRAGQASLAWLHHKEEMRRLAEEEARKKLAAAAVARGEAEASADPKAIQRTSGELMQAEYATQRLSVPVRGIKTDLGTESIREDYVLAGFSDLGQVPERFWRHEKVLAALRGVLGQAIKGGEHEIPGCVIEVRETTQVRTR